MSIAEKGSQSGSNKYKVLSFDFPQKNLDILPQIWRSLPVLEHYGTANVCGCLTIFHQPQII